MRVVVKDEVCKEAKKLYGYFVLLSNDVKDATEALQIYRSKDVVEKAFGNIKERLSGRRMLVSSDASLEGKLFVQFIALIYVSYIRKHMIDKELFGKYTLAVVFSRKPIHMIDKELFGKYTLQGLIDELDLIECFKQPGKEAYIGEMLEKQKQIFLDMDVAVPSNIISLCDDSGI